MTTKVKICGFTVLEDVLDAIDLGADYLGFNFYPDAPRYIDPDKCLGILEDIPPNLPTVGVFVNADPQQVIDIATYLDLDYLQLHGDEAPEYCSQFARPVIKALRPQNESELENVAQYGADFILIDAFVGDAYGGTGVVSNWDLARKAGEQAKTFLAGGLKPSNVEMAIQAVKPFAVDVASGVEKSPGKKDYRLMEEFIKRAKLAL